MLFILRSTDTQKGRENADRDRRERAEAARATVPPVTDGQWHTS